jgi:hypothetical protein
VIPHPDITETAIAASSSQALMRATNLQRSMDKYFSHTWCFSGAIRFYSGGAFRRTTDGSSEAYHDSNEIVIKLRVELSH